MPDTSRRAFLAATMTAASATRVLGANDRVRLGVIGCGGRGTLLMNWAKAVDGFQFVAVCDAWDQRRDKAAEFTGATEKYGDYRRLLDRKDIDAVIVATWDNTHSQIAVDACKAGKDIYVEKPMTSVAEQGLPLVRAVREYRRVLQVGMQQRSMANFIEAKQRFVDSGKLGDVHMVRTVWNSNAGYLTPVPAGMEKKPEGLDWNACLGSLPKMAWDPQRYFNRFAYWDLSTGGQTGGLFVHMVDVVHWYLGLKRAQAAVAAGGIYRYKDGRDTPDNITMSVEYPQGLVVSFEATLTTWLDKQVEKLPEAEAWKKYSSIRKRTRTEIWRRVAEADIVFHGTGGRLSIFRHGYVFTPEDNGAEISESTGGGSPEAAHMRNWLDCLRSRKDPSACVEDGHYSSMACHLGNLAYQQKARVEWRSAWDV